MRIIVMMTIEEKINLLPPDAQEEVYDFIDFIVKKNNRNDKNWYTEISRKSIEKIWDNEEDNIYSELLKG